jgi:hypothetical protein
MKKILGVILLGLFLQGCATAPSMQVQKQLMDQGSIKVGMKYGSIADMMGSVYPIFPFRGKGVPNEYMFIEPMTEFSSNSKSYLYSFKADVSEKSWGGWYKIPFYRLDKIWDSKVDMLDSYLKIATNSKDIAWLAQQKTWAVQSINNKTKVASSSSINTADKITQSKQVCRDLGFKDNTDKFSDCALKMMSIQFETTNKVASASGTTTQEIIVKHQNDYDIWDALVDYSALIDPKNKTTTSSSSSNRGTNCVVGRTNPTFGTTTINCR